MTMIGASDHGSDRMFPQSQPRKESGLCSGIGLRECDKKETHVSSRILRAGFTRALYPVDVYIFSLENLRHGNVGRAILRLDSMIYN